VKLEADKSNAARPKFSGDFYSFFV